jgi:ectoine hydroxylase-related dioxygenase (phytanoyl-CoA dioxygenase family)
VLDAVEGLLGPDLVVWATELFAKHPREPAISIGWHRDATYMGFPPRSSVTAWIALSDSSTENGCLQALPGPDRATRNGNDGTPVNVTLRAGEMSLHDDQILHGSASNRSDKKRVGFAVRFVAPHALTDMKNSQGVVARGRCEVEGFESLELPSHSDQARALAEMKVSAAKHFDAMLERLRTGKPRVSTN